MLVLAFALMAGCAHVTTDTLEHSKKLKIGLTKEEAQKIMGEPYKTEGYLAGETQMESWFYLAGYGYYSAMYSDFLVLEFQNDQLVSWGKRY